MSENYYKILGVEENASKDEIKKAYRNLQMKYHPDRNHGNKDSILMTQKINEAYEVLGDEPKREEYDMMKNHPNPFMRMHSQGGGGMEVPIEKVFEAFFQGGCPPFMMPNMPGGRIHVFGGNGMPNMLNKPVPIIKTLRVTMSQVFSGVLIPLEIERWILEDGQKVFEKETIYVDVPQGVDDNEMLIIRDKGNIINDNCKGDIKLTISVENNSDFRRSGLDLILEKTITLKQSLCGFKFDIHYPNGKTYSMNNAKGNIVAPEYKKIYPNMGIKRGEHTGNMVIIFHITFPEHLTIEQIDKLHDIL